MRLLALALTAAAGSASNASPVLYLTTQGPVYTNVETNSVREFRSIPFAAPPVGALRWQPPQNITPWSDPLDVSSIADMCKQSALAPGVSADHSRDSEDCLYLYVYTSSDPSPPKEDLKPVLLWIHGGAFEFGDAWLSGNYSGSALAEKEDVVVVAAQYRM